MTASIASILFVATGMLIVHDQRRIQKARESDFLDGQGSVVVSASAMV
jgi:hypothetical protein